jgi:hypothetical protein
VPVPDLISECDLHQLPLKTAKFSVWHVTFLAEGDGFDGVPFSETRVPFHDRSVEGALGTTISA